MEDLRETYVQLCKESRIDPQENVLSEMSKMTGSALSFSTCALSLDTCVVLGKLFTTSHGIMDISFCDSMLPEEGLQAILRGLSNNTTVKKLDLKGNNMRGTGAEALGKLLRHNHSLQFLGLEWNALGSLHNKFSLFAEGLAINSSVKTLDLRNNQITHQGAKDIASTLRKNGTLESLDLRWNNIGLLGSRALLEALAYNKTLTSLEFAGNNVPLETAKALGNAVLCNIEKKSLKNEQIHQAQRLTDTIRNLEEGKRMQVCTLMEKLEKKGEELAHSERVSSTRITQLKESLSERSQAFESLSSRLERLQIALSIEESKNKDLSALLKKSQEENADLHQQHHSILNKERKEREEKDAEFLCEIKNLKEEIVHKQQMIESLKRAKKEQEEVKQELANNVDILEKQIKLSEKSSDEQIKSMKERHKELLQEAENQKVKEINRVKSDAADIEKELRNRLHTVTKQQMQSEEEVSTLNAQLLSEKSHCEHMLLQQREKLKAEETQRCGQLEDKLKLLQEAKDNQETHLANQSQAMRKLQARNTSLALEVEDQNHKIDQLQQKLSSKEEEISVQLTKIRLEVKEQLEELEQQRQTNSILKEKLAQITKDFDDTKRQHEEKMIGKDKEINSLKDLLKCKEDHIKHLQEDQVQKASMLLAAVTTYVEGIKQKCSTPSYFPTTT